MHGEYCIFFRELANQLVIGAARIDADTGRFLWVNPALESILEYTSTELLQKTWMELTHPEDLAADKGMVKIVKKGIRNEYGMTKRYITKSGKIIWGSLYVSKITEADTSLFLAAQIVPLQAEQSLQSNPLPTPTPAQPTSFWRRFNGSFSIVAAVLAALAILTAEIIQQLKE